MCEMGPDCALCDWLGMRVHACSSAEQCLISRVPLTRAPISAGLSIQSNTFVSWAVNAARASATPKIGSVLVIYRKDSKSNPRDILFILPTRITREAMHACMINCRYLYGQCVSDGGAGIIDWSGHWRGKQIETFPHWQTVDRLALLAIINICT